MDVISSYSVVAIGLLVRFCQQASSMSSEEGACLSSSQQTPPSKYKQHESNLANKLKIREISNGSVQRDNRHTDQSQFSEIDMWFGLLSLNISKSSQPSDSNFHLTTKATIKVPTSKCAAKYMHDYSTSDRPSSWKYQQIRQIFTYSASIRSSKAKVH